MVAPWWPTEVKAGGGSGLERARDGRCVGGGWGCWCWRWGYIAGLCDSWKSWL